LPHKLLLADDSVTIQRVIELTFAGEDVQVLTAGDGEQAITRVQEDRPDIVLADIGMPKRSGYEVAAFIKGQPEFAHIPVLLLTGAFEPVDEGRARAAGCDGVLVKPFEPQHVIARVRELLQGAQRRSTGLAGGSATRAVANVPRPVERLAPHRPVDLPVRQEQHVAPQGRGDQQSVEDFDFGGAAETARAATGDSLDDYFDRLDQAFANITTAAGEPLARGPEAVEQRVHEPQVLPRPEGPVMEKDLDWFDSPPQVVEHLPQPGVSEAQIPATFASPPSTFNWPAPSGAEGPAPSVVEGLSTGIRQPQPPPPEPADLSPTISPSAPLSAVAPTPVAPLAPIAPHTPNAVADAFSALLAAEEGEPGTALVRLTAAGPARLEVTDELIEEIAQRVIARLGPKAVEDVVSAVVSSVAERLVRDEIARIRKR
jgi:CheY-like chemotaxis protein